MKVISNQFREALRGIREIDTKITYKNNGVDTIIENETIKSVNPLFKVDLFRTICKSVQIESQQDIPLKTWINLEIGVLVNNNYEYLDFGKYYIIDSMFQADTNTYLITAYDKMIESMIKYDENPLEITYPISIKDMLVKVCEKLNWNYDLGTFVNDDKLIKKDLFSGLGLTYRDILDNLSEVAVGNLTFDNNDNLIIKYIDKNNPTNWNENQVVTEEDLKSVNVDIKTKYGKVNTLLISSNNVVLNNITDEQSVTQNGKTEIKIDDNLILIFENEQFIEEMFDYVNGLEFYLYDFDTIGLLFLEPLDKFAVRIDNAYYPTICLNDDIKITSGLVETLYVEEPEKNVNEYVVNDKETSKLNQTAIRIDKQNQEIELLTSKTEETTKTLKIDKSVESNGETITIEDSGGYDLEKLRIDGKSIKTKPIKKIKLIDANGEVNLSNAILSADFGDYTSEEILNSIRVYNSEISFSLTQLGSIGINTDDDSIASSIMATNPNVLEQMMSSSGAEIKIDRDDLESDKYYIFGISMTNDGQALITTIANISDLIVYNNYTISSDIPSYNEIYGSTLKLINGSSYEISNDSIIWNCLLLEIVEESDLKIESIGEDGKIEIVLSNDNQSNKIQIELNEPLRSLESGIKDIYENGVITRRVGITENGELYELDEPITEDIGFVLIPTFKGLNNITLNSNIPTSFGITYLTDSELNRIYATKNQIKITKDEINILSQKVQPVSNVIKSVGQIQLENAYEGILHRLSIKGNISLLFPSSQEGLYGYALSPREGLTPSTTLTPSSPVSKDNKILYPSNELFSRSSNLIIDDVEYKLDFNFLNYINDTDCDEFIYEDGKCWIVRRVGIDENGNLYATGQEVIEPRKDIVLTVKSNSTIKLKSFENAIYETQYLLENEYTSNFVTEVDAIARINLSPGNATIQANKISLEGYTTINEGFSVDLEGNATMNDATINGGDIILKDTQNNPKMLIVDEDNKNIKTTYGSRYIKMINEWGYIWEAHNTNFNQLYLQSQNGASIDINNDNSKNHIQFVSSDGNKKTVIYNSNSTNQIYLDDYANDVELIMNSNGAGDGNPYFKVSKGSSFSSMSQNGVWSPGFNNNSLESKKKNIVLDDGCLQQILETDICSFNWNFEDDTDQKHIGGIINDLGGNYKIAPKALTHDKDAVDLYSMVGMSWKAIQELYDIIKEKDNKIQELEEKLNGIIESN